MTENFRKLYLEEQDKIKKIKICLAWWSSLTPAWKVTFIRSTMLGSMNELFNINEQRYSLEENILILKHMSFFSPDRFISIMNAVFQEPCWIKLNGSMRKNHQDPYDGGSFYGDDYYVWRAESLEPIRGWENVKDLDINFSNVDSLEPVWDLQIRRLLTPYNCIPESEVKKYQSTHSKCFVNKYWNGNSDWPSDDNKICYSATVYNWKDLISELKSIGKIEIKKQDIESIQVPPADILEEDEQAKLLRGFLAYQYNGIIEKSSYDCPTCKNIYPSSAYHWRLGSTNNSPIKQTENLTKWATWNSDGDAVCHCSYCNRIYHYAYRKDKFVKGFHWARFSSTTIEDVVARFIRSGKEKSCVNNDLKLLI